MSRLRNSETVRIKIRLFGQSLGNAAYRFWASPHFPRLYLEYIFQSHSIVRASVPLMVAAERACRKPEHEGDPALQKFARYLQHHIPEETDHHQWILDDGEAMGLKRADILSRIPNESAMQLVGMQYYWIHHYNPIALAGFIATMEGDPPTREFIDDVARRNHLSLNCFSSHVYHAKIDPRHRVEFDDMLDSLPLAPHHMEVIGVSVFRTIGTMTRIMDAIARGADAN